ncbi:uncharacterized protein LOC129905859 [Episyrphus balteatus]|uniref:uncharacterized protein LOC129905859 n=1 Tax=Episyrphus balteatus TaxID=286459 RepID=UPI00248561D7|nr:uncharacterized protein LOC129905859 [Episyrphus balteatus]
MAEFWAILSLLREKCDENPELQQTCQIIADNYLDSEKREIRAQNAYEENLILKLEIASLESIYRQVRENNEERAQLHSLLKEFYKEHLKSAFNVDEFELEKLANYDELKFELESRDSNNVYQQLYWRKLETAKKMEERNIVKRYRQVEQEYLKTKNERLLLEENVEKLKAKVDEFKARRQEEVKLILQLVEGMKTISELDPQRSQSQIVMSLSQRLSGIVPDFHIQRGGLSSKFLMNYKEFAMPQIHAMPRIRQINPHNGLSRLLQQSEVIRKSMQSKPIVLSNEIPTPNISGILKFPKDSNSIPAESAPKTVSFDDSRKDLTKSLESQKEVTTKTTDDVLETIEDSEMEESLIEKETKNSEIKITENLLIKPAEKTSDRDDFKKHVTTANITSSPSFKVPSKSFMDMFLDFDKDTPDVESPTFESIEEPKSKAEPNHDKEKVEKVEEKLTEKKTMEVDINKKQETKTKSTKASKKQFDFDDMFSDVDENNENNDESFDFDTANDIDDDASDNFLF